MPQPMPTGLAVVAEWAPCLKSGVVAGYNGIVINLASGGYLNKRLDAA